MVRGTEVRCGRSLLSLPLLACVPACARPCVRACAGLRRVATAYLLSQLLMIHEREETD